MALVRTACRLLAATLCSCLFLAGVAHADAPPSLLHTATSAVQRTVAQADAIPAHAGAALPLPAAAAPAVVHDLSAGTVAVAATASGTVERAGADVVAVTRTLPQPAPVARVLAPARRALQPTGSSTQSRPPSAARFAPPAGPSAPGRSQPARGAAAKTAAATATPEPGSAPGVASGAASGGAAAQAASSSHSVSMSARGRAGRADAAPEPRALALSLGATRHGAPVAHTASTGGQTAVRPSHGGAQPPVPMTAQGGVGAQAVAGSGGSVGLAMVLVLVLLAWLASFARRLRPPGGAVRDVRLVLALDRPG